MKQLVITGMFLLPAFLFKIQAQDLKTKQAGWQQRVDHDIRAELDAKAKVLRCEETITYTNNSPDVLYEIPMHVWPNAFSSRQTAYGREAVLKGSEKFLQAKKEDLGYLDSLSFVINGTQTTFSHTAEDIILVKLPQPLQPGVTVSIKTPFRVKIPALFSRMGFSNGLFAITQWYPKPAVYDVNGWNTFSYLEQGEYYSDFGNYKVALTLPEDYIVGATGKLQEEKELDWLSELAEGTAEKRSASKIKTLHYEQEDVSDFAWFADPEFTVGEATVKLANGHEVHTYAFLSSATASRTTVLSAIETALNYYSKRVGYYPYDYCSAVIGELKAAGGMEYPMITICGDANEGTIIHEVGHNWFQGMLGNQERRYPWMDESINTFYQLYAEGEAPKEWNTGARANAGGPQGIFRAAHDLGVFQEGDLHSEAYQQVNYGAIVYMANPLRFTYLQEYLGKSVMDSCMHKYFDLWHFKHPLPQDFQDVFEKTSGKDLDWFFQGLLGGGAPDISIKKVKTGENNVEVTINNKSNYQVPVKLEWRSGTKTDFIWLSGSDTTVRVPLSDKLRLNPTGFLPESNIANNDAKTKGLFKTFGKTKFGFPDLYKRGENRVWIFPNVFSSNRYDGFTPGIMISNFTFPRRNWEWWLLPSYGIRSKAAVGMAGIQRNVWFEKGIFSMMEMRVAARSYSFRPDSMRTLQQYLHFEPQLYLFLKRKKAWVQNLITADYSVNRISKAFADQDQTIVNPPDAENNIWRLGWIRESYKKAKPMRWSLFVEGGNNYLTENSLLIYKAKYSFTKATTELRYFIPYHFLRSKGSGLKLKGFASAFIGQKNREGTNGVYNPVVSGANGANDYAYRQLMVNRSENMQSGSAWSNQLLAESMGIRMLPNITADKFAAGVNLESSFAPKVPLRLFFDAAVAGNNSGNALYWAGGVNISQQIGSITSVEINLPLVYSSNFNSMMQGLKWYETFNFKINFVFLQPMQLARTIYQ